MSVCTFIASNGPLTAVDDRAEQGYFLLPFTEVSDYTDKKYGVYLEWDYTDERAEQILRYIKAALKETEVVEFWNKPDKQLPSRPSFYCLRITRID